MKVVVKDLKQCRKSIKIDVPSDLIKQEYDSFYRAAGKNARVPGFRPGKAPREILEMHYGEEAKEEVLKNLISKSLSHALDQEKLTIVSSPEITDINFTNDKLSYTAEVEIRPEVKLKNYAGIKVKRKKVKVEDSEVEDVLNRLREGYAKFSPVEDREARMGDHVIADYKCFVDGKETDSRNDDWFQIKEKDYLPNFSKQLSGAKTGEEKEVKVKFPDDYPRKEFAGKEGIFKVKIKEIKTKELPPLTDEWVKELGEHKSIDELKKAIREDLERRKMQDEEFRLEGEILDKLLKDNQFEVPPKVVERRLNALVEDGVMSLTYRGVKKEEAEKQKDTLREKLKDEAVRQVRLSFILEEISEKEDLKVDIKDLDAKYEEMSRRTGQPKERIMSYYQEENMVDRLEHQILNEKTIRLLKDKAEIGEEK